MERKMWFKAYNNLTPDVPGISQMDFKMGDAVMQSIMFKQQIQPLVKKMMKRMMNLRPETMQKMEAAMKSEQENPTMFKEIIEEFLGCFNSSDANKDGLLDLKEFKAFTNSYYELSAKRYGEAVQPPVKEQEDWFQCYNAITPDADGISLADFMVGRVVVEEQMRKMRNYMEFKPLLGLMIGRMAFYNKET